jgi:hypothetical protein
MLRSYHRLTRKYERKSREVRLLFKENSYCMARRKYSQRRPLFKDATEWLWLHERLAFLILDRGSRSLRRRYLSYERQAVPARS